MDSLTIFLITFLCVFGGTVLGIFLRTFLPEHHLSEDSKDIVKLGTGMIATMAALVLGLLIASAKSNFDTMSNELKQIGSKIILLDDVLAHYGPETLGTRERLRRNVAAAIGRIDKIGMDLAKARAARIDFENILEQIHDLSPRDARQRWLQSRALQVSGEIAEARYLLAEQIGQSSIPVPFLVMLVLWLTIIFTSFGLFSPRNATVIIVLLLCALSAAGALFLIIELDIPYRGLIRISSTPLQEALAQISK